MAPEPDMRPEIDEILLHPLLNEYISGNSRNRVDRTTSLSMYMPRKNMANDENCHPNRAEASFNTEAKNKHSDLMRMGRNYLNTPYVEDVDADANQHSSLQKTPLSQLQTLATTNSKSTIIISPLSIAREMKKERQSQRKKSPNKHTVYERPDVAPFRLAVHGCED